MTLKQLLPEGPFVLVGAVAVIIIIVNNLSVTIPLMIFGAVGTYAGLKLYKKLKSEKANPTGPQA